MTFFYRKCGRKLTREDEDIVHDEEGYAYCDIDCYEARND